MVSLACLCTAIFYLSVYWKAITYNTSAPMLYSPVIFDRSMFTSFWRIQLIIGKEIIILGRDLSNFS